MTDCNAPIGVLDSGIGGLTVVRELRAALPEEELLFLGDGANCPYGSRSEDEIFDLSLKMLRALEARGVKCAVIACNTISAVAERLRGETALELFSIVESACEYIKTEGYESAGLVATPRTVESGIYGRCLRAAGSDCTLTAAASPTLAAIIERGGYGGAEAEAEIRRLTEGMAEGRIILGCTHYPIALELFRRCCPAAELIDPARAQAKAVARRLGEQGALRRGSGKLSVRVTGSAEVCARVCRALGIDGEIEAVEKF